MFKAKIVIIVNKVKIENFRVLKLLMEQMDYSSDKIVQSEKFPVYSKRYQEDLREKWYDFTYLWSCYEHPILFYQENHVIKELAIQNDALGDYDVYYGEGPDLNEYIINGYFDSLETLYLEACFSVNLSQLFQTLRSLKNLRITKIDTKALPESMGNSKSLEIINFTDCRLHKIPETIRKLKNLRQLILDNNSIEILPISISELESLEVLSLERNWINLFPEEICKLKRLKELYLDNNSFSELPEVLGNLTNLEVLSLENTKIKTLPKSIGNLKKLQILNLKKCNLESLPDSICRLKDLIDLRIEGNFISEISEETTKFLLNLGAIPEENTKFLLLNKEHARVLNELESLINEKLTLVKEMNKRYKYPGDTKSNEYEIENNEIIALNIKLRWNIRMDRKDEKKLPNMIGKLTDLKYLECRGAFVEIPEFLENLASLETLKLNGRLEEIKNLQKLKNLKELDLSCNYITEIKGLDTLTDLTSLNLMRNKITQIQGLDNLLHLKKLNLAENKIPEITGLDSLIELDRLNLTENNISEIEGLENLRNLKDISIIYGNNIPSRLKRKVGYKDGMVAGQKYVAYCQQRIAMEPQDRRRKEFLEWLQTKNRLSPQVNNKDLKKSLIDSILSFDFKNDSLKSLIDLYEKLLKCLNYKELEDFIYEKNSEHIYSIIKRIRPVGYKFKFLGIIERIFTNIDQEHFMRFYPEIIKLSEKNFISHQRFQFLYKKATNYLQEVKKATENLVKIEGVKISEKEAIALFELERHIKTMKFELCLYGFGGGRGMSYCVYKNRVIEIHFPLFYYYHYSKSTITTLPKALCDFKALQTLYITSGKDRISSLPDNIGDLTMLKHLIVLGNSITKLPKSVEKLKQLEVLDLSSNKFTRIPDLIAYLPSLERLYISSNPLIIDSKTKNLLDKLRKKGVIVSSDLKL